MDARTEGGEHHHAPVADLVAEPLDDDGPVGGQRPGRLPFLGDESGEIRCRPRVEPVPRLEHLCGRGQIQGSELTDEGADRPAQLEGATRTVAVPEGHAWCALGGSRHHDDAVVIDLADLPGRGSEDEGVTRTRLVDHLLVELSDLAALGEHHGVEATVGDGARVGHGQHPGVATRFEEVFDAVPHDARPQLGEVVRRIPPGEHVQHAVEGGSRQLAIGRRLPHEIEELGCAARFRGNHGDHVLGEHVERIAGDGRGLDGTGVHPVDDDGGLEQIAAMLGEDPRSRGRSHLVTGPSHPLQPPGDGGRGLDHQHQVDRRHVDAEFEGGGGDDALDLTALEVVLDVQPLLAGHRSVVGAGDLVSRQLVELAGDAFGDAPAVGEDDGRAVGLDELQQPFVHRRPDGASLRRVVAPGAGVGHVADRDDHFEVELLVARGVDDLHRPGSPGSVVDGPAADEAGDVRQRALGGRQPDPLRPIGQLLEALQGQGQVGAALGAGDGVDLVDDHPPHRPQRLADPRGEHEVERFGGGDEDPRGVGGEAASLLGGCVTRPHADRDLGQAGAAAGGRVGDPGEGGAQVALDVVGERLER